MGRRTGQNAALARPGPICVCWARETRAWMRLCRLRPARLPVPALHARLARPRARVTGVCALGFAEIEIDERRALDSLLETVGTAVPERRLGDGSRKEGSRRVHPSGERTKVAILLQAGVLSAQPDALPQTDEVH